MTLTARTWIDKALNGLPHMISGPRLANLLGVTPPTARRLLAEGEIDGAIRLGRTSRSGWRIPLASVRRFLQQGGVRA